MAARDERVDDLFFIDLTSQGNPTEEGQTRRVSGDIVTFVGGQVRSLTQAGNAEFDKLVTARTNAMVFVFRTNGNVITYR